MTDPTPQPAPKPTPQRPPPSRPIPQRHTPPMAPVRSTPSGMQPPLRPAPRPLPAKPRKVRGGLKVPAGDIAPPASPTAWTAHRWLRVLEQAVVGQPLIEGLDYARQGQTKRMTIGPGSVVGGVQGRSDRPYTPTISVATFTTEQWDKVVESMSEGAIYAAKLLAGELPPNIEDIFGPLGLKLFPTEPSELTVSCDCRAMMQAHSEATAAAARAIAQRTGQPVKETPAWTDSNDSPWCKHVCCIAYLLAHKLATEPFLMFTLRGMEGKDLLERLRQRRTLTGMAGISTPVYPQRVPGVSDASFPTLEEVADRFWDAGPGLHDIDLPLGPPPVSHPLLRRLGPSPFTNAQFPLVGLLASCYDTISEAARRTDEAPAAEEAEPPRESEPESSEPELEGDDLTA